MSFDESGRALVGTREAARLAGVSEQTMRKYKQEGLVSGHRDPQSGYRKFVRDEVLALKKRT